MRVLGLWFGGNGSWRVPDADDLVTHGETWVSLRAAKSDLWRRAVDGFAREARVADWDGEVFTVGAVEDSRTACVEVVGCYLDLYPVEAVGRGRWRIVSREAFARVVLGPRLGVRVVGL